MVARVGKFLLALLTILLITTPTNSNVTGTKEYNGGYYFKPVKPLNYIRYSNQDIDCLAKNIYFEAGVESTAGKLAVANVTLNRTVSDRYPNSVCEVVKEGKHRYNANKDEWFPLRDMCQFSWYCDGRGDDPNPGRTWEDAKDLASLVLHKYQKRILIDITDGATHYHANWMESFPSWSFQHKKVASIDRHIFYKANKRR
jgi:spore germination cell wall hydrolase CwlJ-like protein